MLHLLRHVRAAFWNSSDFIEYFFVNSFKFLKYWLEKQAIRIQKNCIFVYLNWNSTKYVVVVPSQHSVEITAYTEVCKYLCSTRILLYITSLFNLQKVFAKDSLNSKCNYPQETNFLTSFYTIFFQRRQVADFDIKIYMLNPFSKEKWAVFENTKFFRWNLEFNYLMWCRHSTFDIVQFLIHGTQ